MNDYSISRGLKSTTNGLSQTVIYTHQMDMADDWTKTIVYIIR